MFNRELEVEIEKSPDYLYVKTSGRRSRETVKDLSIKVFNVAREENISKILLDVRELIGPFGFIDISFLVREVLQDLHDKGVNQVAVIDIKRTIGLGWFLEPISQSHGFDIRVFDDELLARKWLGKQEL